MKVITIGRSSENDITVNNPNVSRHHCQIVQFDNGTFGVVDFDSTNGTFVNGQRVYGQVSLKWGDRVHVAQTELPWQQYFPAASKKRTNWWLWPTIGGAAAAMTLLIVLVTMHFASWRGKDICFSGTYPPLTQMEFEMDGNSYRVEAVQGQVMVYFAEGVSHREALRAIKKAGGKVVAQIPKAHYYLVNTNVGEESAFMQEVRLYAATDYVYPNAVSYTCAANSYVMDDFTDKSDGATHGEMVSYTLQECGTEATVKHYEENVDGSGLKWSEIVQDLNNILSNSSEDISPVINMSFGVPLKVDGKNVYWKDAPVSAQSNYRKAYINEMKYLLKEIEQYEDKDFVIVKATGNDGVKDFEKEILTPLYKSLNKKQRALMDKHVILVSAEDSRWREYSNELEEGVNHHWVTKVDISDLKYKGKDIHGTSFSTPRTSCFISTASEKYKIKPTEILQYVRDATEQAPGHILTQDLLEKVIEDHLDSASEVTIEGVLKMYLLDNSGSGSTTYYIDTNGRVEYAVGTDDSHGREINQYRSTNEDEYIAFVVESDKIIDVRKYLDESEVDLLDKNQYSVFMVVPNSQYSRAEFAAKYANKRVRVTGTLYVPGGGWRNATEVVMDLRDIRLFESRENDKKSKTTSDKSVSTTQQGVPAGLVGTRWTTPQIHDNWTGKKRTLEFVNKNQVKVTYETLFYLISTSDEVPAPQVVRYNYYYNSENDKIEVFNKDNYLIMEYKYKNGRLVEPGANSLGDIEYIKL